MLPLPEIAGLGAVFLVLLDIKYFPGLIRSVSSFLIVPVS